MSGMTSVQQIIFGFVNNIVVILFICLGTIMLANAMRRIFVRYLEKSSSLINVNPGQFNFLRYMLTAAIYICGITLAVYMIPPLRNLSLSIFAGSGILAVIIGFASQHSIANIVSGIFITIFKPFRVGDRVKMMGKDITGTVEDITLRHTVIKTFENKRVLVPNSIISSEVVENSNIVDEKICKFIEMSISYGSDINKALKIMEEESLKHPDAVDNRTEEEKQANEPLVKTRVIGLGDSSVNLRAWVWAPDQPSAFLLGCDLYKSIKERFDKEGIEIPYPHRSVVLKNSNLLTKNK